MHRITFSLCIYIILIFIFLPPFFSSIADEEADAIIIELQKKYHSISDFSVSFKQKIVFGVTRAEQTFSGKLFMKKENRYRIEMEKRTIVTDGKSVWSYNSLNHQVLIDAYKEDPNSFSPENIFVNLPNTYSSTIIGKEEINDQSTSVVKLIPKNAKKRWKWMKVWVDTDDWLMRKIEVLDRSDNLTSYFLTNITIDTGFPDSLFHFRIPPGAEVIDLR